MRPEARTWWLIGLGMSAWNALGCGPTSVASGEAAPRVSVLSVSVAPIERGPVTRSSYATGVLGVDRESLLAFKVPGVLQRVLVDRGSRVAKGQLLAVVDPTELQAGDRQASASLGKAELDFQRAELLHDKSAISNAALENAATAAKVARAVAQGAAFNLRHTTLYAPSAGVIERRLAHAGEIVGAGQPVLQLSAIERGRVVRVGLTDLERMAVHEGERAEVRFDALPKQVFSATVSKLATSITASTATFEMELQLDSAAANDFPSGLTAKVKLTQAAAPTLQVPLPALVDGSGLDAYVYVLEQDNRVRRRRVEVESLTDTAALVHAGLHNGVLQSGGLVVTSRAHELHDGMQVQVVQSPED